MKIKFGTPMTSYRPGGIFVLCLSVVGINFFNVQLQNGFGESEQSILHSRGLNVTYKPPLFFCDLPYDDCLCPVLLNTSHTSENCIHNLELVVSRILPVISFMFQIFFVRELFSLSADHRRVIICALWATCIFIGIGITIIIYWSSCSHGVITCVLLCTSGVLLFLSWHNLVINVDRVASSSNHTQFIIAQRSKTTNNAGKSCLELL